MIHNMGARKLNCATVQQSDGVCGVTANAMAAHLESIEYIGNFLSRPWALGAAGAAGAQVPALESPGQASKPGALLAAHKALSSLRLLRSLRSYSSK
jgi:hypothetical protein